MSKRHELPNVMSLNVYLSGSRGPAEGVRGRVGDDRVWHDVPGRRVVRILCEIGSFTACGLIIN
jgi:hypothetical protein